MRYFSILKRVIGFELIPYLALLFSFYIYTILDFNSVETNSLQENTAFPDTLRWIIIVLYFYYFLFQVMQVVTQRFSFLMNAWNILDVSLLGLLLGGEIFGRNRYSVRVN